MSRTSFALRFKANAGVAPLTYLQNLRMRLAEQGLREGAMSVSELAESLGYESDSAFSNAFKRRTGMAPKHYQSVLARMDRPTSDPSRSESTPPILSESLTPPASTRHRHYFCAVGRTTISFTSTSGGCSIANAIARAIASAGIAKVSRDCSSWALTV